MESLTIYKPLIEEFKDIKGLLMFFENNLFFKKKILTLPRREIFFTENNNLIFSIGQFREYFGFRYYSNLVNSDHVILLFDISGKFQFLFLGEALSSLRTGLTGGVALKYLYTKNNNNILGLIGIGLQAYTHLISILNVCTFKKVTIFSRDSHKTNVFVRKIKEKFDINIIVSEDIKIISRESDVLLTSTNSKSPILKYSWLKKNVLLLNVGNKKKGNHELPKSIYKNADYIFTDSISQLKEYKNCILSDKIKKNVIQIDSSITKKKGLLVYFSVGIAGSEILLADYYLKMKRDEEKSR